MIPASYMFKDLYHQQWEEEAPSAPQTAHFQSGLMTPVQRLLRAMLHRASKTRHQYFGVHAYH